jgi:hypothetical protein
MNQSVKPSALESAANLEAIPAVAHPVFINRVFSAPLPTLELVPEMFVGLHPQDAVGSAAAPLQV